jgi:hypothetical protein
MSMYNMVFGNEGPRARGGIVLALLRFTAYNDVGRYRDAWIERNPDTDQIELVVYTRNGGGNREECWYRSDDGPIAQPGRPDSIDCSCPHCVSTYKLPTHPAWLRSMDDSFDSTYRREFFQAPEPLPEELMVLVLDVPINPDVRWRDAIAALNQPQV